MGFGKGNENAATINLGFGKGNESAATISLGFGKGNESAASRHTSEEPNCVSKTLDIWGQIRRPTSRPKYLIREMKNVEKRKEVEAKRRQRPNVG